QQYHQVLVEYQDLKRFRSSLVSVSPSTNIRDKVHLMRKTTGNNENDLPNQQTNYDDQNRSSCTNSINGRNFSVSSKKQVSRNVERRRHDLSKHQKAIAKYHDGISRHTNMDAIELALRKCLHVFISSTTVTERKRNVETFVELLKDNRIHELLDKDIQDETTAKCSITWNEMFNVIREYTIDELSSIRTKSTKNASADIKYQEALKLFRTLIENANTRAPELDGRPVIESIISIIISEAWSSCAIVIKELSHLLITNVLSFHKYVNELREQEWTDLCNLYMSLSKTQNKLFRESDQALYSSYLKFLIEKFVVYYDLDLTKSSIRKDLFEFLKVEIEQLKNSNHFSVIENLLCSLNSWSFKYLFDMPDEVYHLGNELLPSLIDIWRRKCSDKPKTEIIKFSRLQMSIHHPNHRQCITEVSDDIWIKNLRDINDLILREIDEICHKQRLNNRQNQNEFIVRFDLLHLASSVFYQFALNKIAIKNELIDNDNDDDDETSFEPSSKRARYENSMCISTNVDLQLKYFQNLFQSIDPHHQAVGFQIVSLQLERNMILSLTDCNYYITVIKRFLTDERRPSLLVNALRCLHLLFTNIPACQLTPNLIILIQPLIHIQICESYVIEILSIKNLSLSNFCSCSSITSLKYVFHYLTLHPNNQYLFDDEDKLINKLMPDLISLYRNNEHDLSIFFASYSPEYTHICALILMQFNSFDIIPNKLFKTKKKSIQNEFNQIEFEWSRLKLLFPFQEEEEQEQEEQFNFCTTLHTCELNLNTFKRILEIYERNVRFIQQLKDKHLGERNKLLLHFGFLGINMLHVLQIFFTKTIQNNMEIIRFIEMIQILFSELTEETNFLYTKNQDIPFVNDLFEHIKISIYLNSSSSLLQPILPSLNKIPSILYGFLDAKFLSYLYNFATQELSKTKSSDIEGVECPIDSLSHDKLPLIQTFEILLSLCFQALYDKQYYANSFLLPYCLNYQSNINLLIRILEEKIYLYLEELSLPDPISYQYLNRFFSHICLNKSQYYLNIRLSDFEYLTNLFSQTFRIYRRDILLCQRFIYLFHLFIKIVYRKVREKLFSNENWLHLKKIIDAFWQMTINKNTLLNNNTRKLMIQMKQILIHDELITFDDIQIILNDSSYFIRLEANKLCLNLFYESNSINSQNQCEHMDDDDDDDRSSLGIFLGYKEISNEFVFNNQYCLKSSHEQTKIYQCLIEKNCSSILFFYYLSNISEHLSHQIAFHIIEIGLKNSISKTIVKYLLRNVPIESIIQYWRQQTSYKIKDFPWDVLNTNSIAQYHSFLFSTYFLSSASDRQQLDSLFHDMKSSLIDYFPQLQAYLLPSLVNKMKDNRQAEYNRQLIEKIITKTEYNRLMKQKLTMIIVNLLLTYSNNEENEFYDKWLPEPILPVSNWSTLKDTFDYIKQVVNAKTFSELLIKLTDIGEILHCLSSNLFSTNSLHEQLRLLNVYSLFLTDILLKSVDNDYLHSILRDSTYLLLRYIEKTFQNKYFQIYQQELNNKILNIICKLLHQLCTKGFEFSSSIYLHHIPDIISTLINYAQYLTKKRIQNIFIYVYEFIKHNDDPTHTFISYTIEKLGYLTNEMKKKQQIITTTDYFLYLSQHRSSLPVQWILEMFCNHLENERLSSSQCSLNIDPSIVAIVKQKLLGCIKLKQNHILAGKCLSKCSLFLTNRKQENAEKDPHEQVPLWIIDDLIMLYLIDKEQSIVECTRYTLKNILNHSIGQEIYQKHIKNELTQIYSKPFLSQINFSSKIQRNLNSSSNPWLITSFDTWLISLVNYLLKQIEYYYIEEKEIGHPYACIFIQLKQLVQLKIELAKKLFPHLIYCLLLLPTNVNIRQLLTNNFTFLLEQLNNNAFDNDCTHIQIAKIFFRTINYLRQCPIENLNKRNPGKNLFLNFENHFWLDIDYFQLAKCASKYQCYQSAIIYTDIWTTKQRSILPANDYLTHLYYSDIDLLSSSDLIDLFVRIHSNLNQSDEFYGLDKCFQNRPSLYGEFNQLNNNYYDSLFYYDQAALTMDSSKLIQSLRLCGFNHILEQYLHQISPVSDQIYYRIQLTSLLSGDNKLTQWKTNDEKGSNCIRENILSIIQRQMQVPSSSVPQLIDHNLWSNVSDLRECSLINIIDDITMHYKNPEILLKIWFNQVHNQIKEDMFDENDEILLTRVAMTHKLLLHNINEDTEHRTIKQTILADLVTNLCQNALDSKKLQLCDRYLTDLSPLIDPSYSHELSFLRAKVLVLRQQDTAGEYLRHLIESPLPDSIHIRCRLLLCDWLNETRCEPSTTIKQQLDLISNSIKNLDTSSLPLIFESYLAMAHFSDNEYQRLNQLFHSPTFENKRSLITRNQIEYNKQEKLDPLGRYTKVLKRSLDMDKKEIDEQKKLQYSYLISTLSNYLICLKLFSNLSKKQQTNQIVPTDIIKKNSVPEIMITSKCLSYWFANSNNEDVNKTLKKNLLHIPTYFFLPFVYQMAARMALTNEKVSLPFHSVLLEYLSRCIIDHPHHVLPVIFALANAHKDAHISQQSQATSSGTVKKSNTIGLIQLNNESNNDVRSRAAQYLLDQCAKVKPLLVDQMRKLNDAYIEAAYWDVTPTKADQQGKDNNGKNPSFPKQLRLMHIKDLHEVAVPTITIPIAIDGIYKNIETVKSFNAEYAMVGGVNAPKKILCHSSTGRQLSQLLKGKDDLRQDAVMQQLFTVVNRLLDKDDLTCHRSLNIRTYKVVPLTQKSGVLEWCDGTITFGDYLTKIPDGAHSRYHSEDWAAMDCRRHIHKATNAGKDERKRAFIQTCSKLKPVFRYFFYEYYNKPSVWHGKKQAYARSVASSSIVGYIVGLGDRHVQNILIDTQTAEFIHIDLGVAFDQGKMLPIPETIPFRLTRDVIDGLGICGTQGLFKKSCEITLELMRRYADTLITIIEVFLYDPLYQWQLSPQKALQLQQQFDKTNDSVASSSSRASGKTSMQPASSSTSSSIVGESVTTDTNKMAERLLLGLRQKLQGVERLNQMTIKAHVNMLIQEATSIDNLSQLFAGWQPYL
ncbi:unnamed protein product, partial [Rotaria magnacalcarata]